MAGYDGPTTEYTGMAETGIVVTTTGKYTFQAMYPFTKACPSKSTADNTAHDAPEPPAASS